MRLMNIVPSIKINRKHSCDNHYVIPAITEESKEIDNFQKIVKEVK